MNHTQDEAKKSAHTVLVVEDDIFISDLLGRKLGVLFRVLHAPTVEAAEKLLAADAVDLICLDINLPGVNGLDFLKELREKEEYKAMPIMVVSNHSQKDEIEEALAAGANDYLIKSSVFLDEIVEKAERLINGVPGDA